MAEITSRLASANPRQIRIRRGRITCVAGKDAGQSWLVDRDVITIGQQRSSDIFLDDPTVSRAHCEVARDRDGVLLRDVGSTNGTFVGAVRVREVYLTPETRFRVGQTELLFTPEDQVIEVEPYTESRFEALVGASLAMRDVFAVLEKVAPTNLTVLVTGETGTGKELASRAVHERSTRVGRPFVVFDCGAAAEGLIESELFGHERGAFTGAVSSRPGVFEQAHGGTVFLDEIGELPIDLQPKLLRVLEQREVRRVGSGKVRKVDVRVVAATNRALREEVAAGRFREDLYYRLAVVEVSLPALRERQDDIALLVGHLLRRASHNPHGIEGVVPEVERLFRAYHWPGNVRELCNVLERAIPFTNGMQIDLDSLPEAMRNASTGAVSGASTLGLEPDQAVSDLPFKDAKDKLIEAFERQYLLDLLERNAGNISRAARSAQMDRKSISRLLKKHGISAR